jgi:hypothetical protein
MSESLKQFWDDNRQNITYVAVAGALVVAGVAVYRKLAPELFSLGEFFSWRSKKVDFDLEKNL